MIYFKSFDRLSPQAQNERLVVDSVRGEPVEP